MKRGEVPRSRVAAEARWIAQRIPLIRRLRAALGEDFVLYADGD